MFGLQNNKKSNNRQFQEAATQRKAANDTQFFWDLVARSNAGQNVGPRKLSRAHEENLLFGRKSEERTPGVIDDGTPVQRSGTRSDEVSVLEGFEELSSVLPPSVTKCIELLKFEKPTPIQKHAIPLGLASLDLMCCAQTGSGKTLAFLIPVITSLYSQKEEQNSGKIDSRGVLPRAIILAPTRELASQIHLDARRLTFTSTLRSVCVYGGNDIRNQLVELCVGCDVIVATPGRLNDLVDRGIVSLSAVNFLVLDEADRMLDMGFEPQIRRIVLEYDMPQGENRQTFMFSATFPNEIQTLAREFLRNYVWIAVGRVGSTVDNIRQQVLLAGSDPQEKIKLLLGVLEQTEGRTLVFVQKRKTASWLCETLRAMFGISAEEIHGDRSQAQRENALKLFRDGNIRILVATDVAARGLDVPAVTHVVQFDMPLSPEDFDVYVHRIGRTGRAGMSGLATSFFVPGREVGEGNGRIAAQLLRLLRENNQEIPDWLMQLEDQSHGSNHMQQSFRKGSYTPHAQSRGSSYNNNGGRFGYADSRVNQQTMVYSSNNYEQRTNSGPPAFNSRNIFPRNNNIQQVHHQPPQTPQHQPQQQRMISPYTQQYYHPYNPPPVMHYPQHVTNAMPPAPPTFQAPTAAPQLQTGYHNQGYYDPYMANYIPNNSQIVPSMVETPPYSHLTNVSQQSWVVPQNTSANTHSYNPSNQEADLSNRPANVDYSKSAQDFHFRSRGQHRVMQQQPVPQYSVPSVSHSDFERQGPVPGRQFYTHPSENHSSYKMRDQYQNNSQMKTSYYTPKADYYPMHQKISNSSNEGKDPLDVDTVDPSSHYNEANPDAISNETTEEN